MVLFIFIIACTIALPIVGLTTFWQIHHWWDFYIPIVLLIGGLIGGILITFMITGFCSLLVRTHKDRMKPSKFAYWWLSQGITCIDIFSHVKCTVVGMNKLPKNKPFVLVCNHRSNYDPMIIVEKLKLHQIAFISKESNFKIPMVGRFMRGSCYQAIDREDPGKALATIKKCVQLLKDGRTSIGVFPEGTRQREKIIGDFHEGVFNIAIHANAPLVICAIKGTENISKRAPFKKTKVILKIIGVIQPDELSNYTAKAISDMSHQLMEDYLSE